MATLTLEEQKERKRSRYRAWQKSNPEKHRERIRKWRLDNPVKSKNNQAKWKKANPKKIKKYEREAHKKRYATEKYRLDARNRKLKKTYGISIEQYNAMLNAQNSRCCICDRHQSEFKKSFAVDHDHLTGKIRSLLCPKCNTGIGNLQDSIEIVTKALDYLKGHT